MHSTTRLNRSTGLAKKTLAAAIALLCTATAQSSEETLQEVVVTASPIRDSQQAAIDAKREAYTILDVISADTIGRFPDQNLADSLGRVPGIAIERDQGQARYINFRGMPFRYTSISFDGISVPGAENGRIPRFDSFPSAITKKVEVNKAVMPSTTGEAVAGHINIETFSPFDRQGVALAADLGLGEQDLGGGDVDKQSVRLSYSNDQLGVMVFHSNNSRQQITDNHEYELARTDSGELLVDELQSRSYKLEREDTAYGGRLEYRGEELVQRAFISMLYSEFVDQEERNHYEFGFDSVVGNSAEDEAVSVNRLLQFGRYDNSTDTTTGGLDLAFGDWQVALRANQTDTEFTTYLPILYDLGGSGTASYDVSDLENPVITLAESIDDTVYGLNARYILDEPLNIDAWQYKADISRQMTLLGSDSEISFGVVFDQREADGYLVGAFGMTDFDPTTTNDFLTAERWHNNSPNSLNARYYDNRALRSAWAAVESLTVTPDAEDIVDLEEDILSLYAMANQQFSWGQAVWGVRIEQTDFTSRAMLDLGGEALENVVVENDFTHVLPSLALTFDLRDDLKARAALSTGVNRPTYIEWRAAASVNPTNQTVSGGNPALKAEKARGLDLSLEYYFAPASLLSAGLFYRDIDNVIYEASTNVDGGLYNAAFAGQSWELNGYVNGRDGELSGFEINLIGQASDLLPALEGFGASANITFMDSEFTALDGNKYDLPGTSDMLYNASIYYERYGLSARVNYQFRDEWISPIESPDEVWGEQKRVDFSLSYQLPYDVQGATVAFYANANNLTDEVDLRYAANGTPNQVESYGAHYLLGVRINY